MKQFLFYFVLSAISASAYATPVTYTETFIASGSLGGVAYAGQLITLSETSDTANVTRLDAGVYDNLSAVTVKIGSGGAASFTSDSFGVFDNQNNSRAGFGDYTYGVVVEFTGSPIFGTYDLTTSVIGSGTSVYNPGYPFPTTSGSFVITSIQGGSTFSAVVGSTAATPEPSGLMLLGCGALGLIGTVRRKLVQG